MINTLVQFWPDIVKIALLLLNILAFAGGSSAIIEWLKGKLGWEDAGAKVLAWVVQGVVGIVNAIAVGTIAPELFTSWVDFLIVVAGIFMASEGFYKFQAYKKRPVG